MPQMVILMDASYIQELYPGIVILKSHTWVIQILVQQ